MSGQRISRKFGSRTGEPFFGQQTEHRLRSKKLMIVIEPLPPEGEGPLHQVLQRLCPWDLLLTQHALHTVKHIYRLQFSTERKGNVVFMECHQVRTIITLVGSLSIPSV
jgi:hypothetical protein